MADDAFGNMFEMMQAGDLHIDETFDNIGEGIESTQYVDEMGVVENLIKKLDIPDIKVDPQPLMVEVVEFDPNNNVLDKAIRDRFRNEIVFDETDIFTQPISTTNTMEGYFSNVAFHERDLIEELLPDEDLVLYRCNFGKVKYEFYTEPVKVKKTNRGRKPKEKPAKTRKKQGAGVDFNSQITFVVRSTLTKITNGVVPPDTKVFKFKVFRTGKLQLPGIKNEAIDDVIACTKIIAKTLNFHLHVGETDPTKITDIININPVMKNYKFVTKLPPKHIINMTRLKTILQKKQRNQFIIPRTQNELADKILEVERAVSQRDKEIAMEEANEIQARLDALIDDSPPHPPIFYLKPNHTKLSIKFTTPIFKKKDKRTRINIFMRGKINILGAFDVEATRQICNYLHWIFKTYFNEVVVMEGGIDEEPEDVGNIEPMCEMDASSVLSFFDDYTPPLPSLSTDDYSDIMSMVDSEYRSLSVVASNYAIELFPALAQMVF